MNEALILAWRAFESDFSRAARSSLSYFLNAKAYDFKDAILPKLASRTTTRAQGFLKKRLGVDRIRDRNTPIDQQAAAVSINKGDRKAQNFTAWAEWLKPGWRPRKYRYTKFARGGDYKNRVRPRYVDRSAHAAGQGGEGYHVVAGGRYEALRFLRDLKRGKVSIRNAFFMGPGQISSKGTEWREGLYTVDADGKLFMLTDHTNPLPRVSWNWRKEITDAVERKYNMRYVYETFFNPTLTRVLAARNRRRTGGR